MWILRMVTLVCVIGIVAITQYLYVSGKAKRYYEFAEATRKNRRTNTPSARIMPPDLRWYWTYDIARTILISIALVFAVPGISWGVFVLAGAILLLTIMRIEKHFALKE